MNTTLHVPACALLVLAACATLAREGPSGPDSNELVLERLWLRNPAGQRVAMFEATDSGARIRLWGPKGNQSGEVVICAEPNDSYVRITGGESAGRIELNTALAQSDFGMWSAEGTCARLELRARQRGGTIQASRYEPADIPEHPDAKEVGGLYFRVDPDQEPLMNTR
jgi:hypothetical protein